MTAWTGSYQGRLGQASARFSTWVEAANWLRAIIEAVAPRDGIDRVRAALREAAPDAPIAIPCGPHDFQVYDRERSDQQLALTFPP
jgi:hypothetical protein